MQFHLDQPAITGQNHKNLQQQFRGVLLMQRLVAMTHPDHPDLPDHPDHPDLPDLPDHPDNPDHPDQLGNKQAE